MGFTYAKVEHEDGLEIDLLANLVSSTSLQHSHKNPLLKTVNQRLQGGRRAKCRLAILGPSAVELEIGSTYVEVVVRGVGLGVGSHCGDVFEIYTGKTWGLSELVYHQKNIWGTQRKKIEGLSSVKFSD